MKDTFRYFIRKNYPKIGSDISNEKIDEIGILFHNYLDGKLSEKQKENILPKNPSSILMNANHPLMMNGFHPAYLYHFMEWVKEQSERSSGQFQ